MHNNPSKVSSFLIIQFLEKRPVATRKHREPASDFLTYSMAPNTT